MTTEPTAGGTPSARPSWAAEQAESLARWEERSGVPPLRVPRDKDRAVELLEMTTAERATMTGPEAAEAELVLQRYAAFLTRLAQQEEANAGMLDEHIVRIISPRILQQGAYDHRERRALAIHENEVAKRLDLELSAARAKAKRLAYLAMRVDKVASAYGSLAASRRSGRNEW